MIVPPGITQQVTMVTLSKYPASKLNPKIYGNINKELLIYRLRFLQNAEKIQKKEVYNMAKFQKGHSGNPTGKKPGTPNKRTKLAKLFEPHAEKLIDKTIELALAGDVNALRLSIERLIPKATNQQIQIDLQDLDVACSSSLSTIGKKIFEAITNGAVTPDDGKQLMSVLDSQSKLILTTDLSRRLDILENQIVK